MDTHWFETPCLTGVLGWKNFEAPCRSYPEPNLEAVSHGAKIISASWGGSSSNPAMRLAIERPGTQAHGTHSQRRNGFGSSSAQIPPKGSSPMSLHARVPLQYVPRCVRSWCTFCCGGQGPGLAPYKGCFPAVPVHAGPGLAMARLLDMNQQ